MSHNGALRLPVLYKKSSTGAIQSWEIGAHPRKMNDPGSMFDAALGAIVTHYGQVGGAIQTTTDIIYTGKNTGKVNATTPLEQARAEAEAKWTKKKKSGYVESLDDAKAGEVDSVIEGGVLPMLAPNKSYPMDDELGKRIVFPCYFQPKLDGMRCVAVIEAGRVTLWSRTRKRIRTVPHIVAALEARFRGESLVLDGELYNHDYRDRFEDLISLLRGDEPDAAGEYLNAQYHVYDLIAWEDESNMTTPFSKRLENLTWLLTGVRPPVFLVTTKEAECLGDLKLWYEEALTEGFEGGMARNRNASYESGKRSKHLQKMKPFEDREYPIIGVVEGRGKDAGSVGAFICRAENGKEFNCRLAATYDKKREYFLKPELWKGKQMTITRKRLTADGIPYIPIGKAVRDYE